MIVDLYTSPSCPLCLMTKQKLDQYKNFLTKFTIREFNPMLSDEDYERAKRYNVTAAPTRINKKDDEVVLRLVKEQPDEVIRQLKDLIK